MKPFLIIIAGLSLAACASPIPPSKSEQDLQNSIDEFNRLNEITSPGTAPTGTAEFVGALAADVIVDEEPGATVLGDLTLTIDFADQDTGVTGSVRNITLYDEGTPDQDLGGSLSVAGGYDGAFSATASGDLTAVEEDGAFGLQGTTSIVLDLTGDLIDDAGTNTLIGDVTGGSTGGDYDVAVDGLGGFYAVEQ